MTSNSESTGRGNRSGQRGVESKGKRGGRTGRHGPAAPAATAAAVNDRSSDLPSLVTAPPRPYVL